MTDMLDLTSDLKEVALLAGDPAQVDDLFERALDAMAELVPYDLAAVLELVGSELRVRCARGKLASEDVRAHRLDLGAHPDLRRTLEARRAKILTEDDHAPGGGGDPYDGVLDLPHGHSCMVVPLYSGDRTLGAITFDRVECGHYQPSVVDLVTVYGQIVALAMAAAQQTARLERSNERLAEENRLLVDEVTGRSDAGDRLERSADEGMQALARMAKQVAVTETPVLITGETGSGKEVVARAIHDWSARGKGADGQARRPFVKLNCAALPENLVESELFGHAKGAFTGAGVERPGRFAIANGGTLLLDEIGDLPLGAQAKLLRVLQEGTYEPVGSDRTVKVDVRILAATHVDLERAIEAGRFREDLYYRLNVFPLHVPALRERPSDVAALAHGILAELSQRSGRGPWRLSTLALERMQAYGWPGNVRELVNALERATILCPVGELDVDPGVVPGRPARQGRSGRAELRASGPGSSADEPWITLAACQADYIRRVLEHTGGRVYGELGAAEILGMKPSTLQSRMAKLGVSRLPEPAAD